MRVCSKEMGIKETRKAKVQTNFVDNTRMATDALGIFSCYYFE